MIPVHPSPSFFETTVVRVPVKTTSPKSATKRASTRRVDHKAIEKILERPKWSFQDAMARLDKKRTPRKKASSR